MPKAAFEAVRFSGYEMKTHKFRTMQKLTEWVKDLITDNTSEVLDGISMVTDSRGKEYDLTIDIKVHKREDAKAEDIHGR